MKFITSLIGILVAGIFATNAFAQSAAHQTITYSGTWENSSDNIAKKQYLRFRENGVIERVQFECHSYYGNYILTLKVRPFRNYTGVDQNHLNVQVLIDGHPYQFTSHLTEWFEHPNLPRAQFISAEFSISVGPELLRRMYFGKELQFGIPGVGWPYSLIELDGRGATISEFQNAISTYTNDCETMKLAELAAERAPETAPENVDKPTENTPQADLAGLYDWSSYLDGDVLSMFALNRDLGHDANFRCADHHQGSLSFYFRGNHENLSFGEYNVRVEGSGGSQFFQMQRRQTNDMFAFVRSDHEIWRDFKTGQPISFYVGDQLLLEIGNVAGDTIDRFLNECSKFEFAANEPVQELVQNPVQDPLSGQNGSEQQRSAISNIVNYSCSNGAEFAVRYEDNGQTSSATLIMQGIPEITLPQVVSGSGNKFYNGQLDWHIQGVNGILTQNGQSLSCFEQ